MAGFDGGPIDPPGGAHHPDCASLDLASDDECNCQELFEDAEDEAGEYRADDEMEREW